MATVTHKVELPISMQRAHYVFHVSTPKKCKTTWSNIKTAFATDIHENKEHVVKNALDKKKINHQFYYLIHFDGTSNNDAIWISKSLLSYCKEDQ